MNNKGQVWAVLVFIGFLFILTSFALIEPFKEQLDVARNGTALNCAGSDSFNQTAFDEQGDLEQLTKRPTCFIAGISFTWFYAAWIFAVVIWVVSNLRKIRRR